MKPNVAYSVGNLAVVDKVDGEMGGYFEYVFGDAGGKAKDFVPLVKLFCYNRLGDCLSTNRLTEYPEELFDALGFEESPSERSPYRLVQRIGKKYQFILERHQALIARHGLVSEIQFMDFSSSYFEGKADAMGEFGYSRDGMPGKRQITFGISTGINGIPTALTIQKGNVQDKAHFRFMLKAAEALLERHSVLVFDCGANCKENKRLIREAGFHYLTLKGKKRRPYRDAIWTFKVRPKTRFILGDRHYECVKVRDGDEIRYIFFSPELKADQLRLKDEKFQRELERNQVLLDKTLAGKPLGEYPCSEGDIIAMGQLQKLLDGRHNPRITGIEGYFILESSIDVEPECILKLYKNRDIAEKLIRNIKEGTELRPMRHWSKDAIIGYVVLVFLTNFLVQLTLHKAEKPLVKNVKLLKKYLGQLTVAVVYPPIGFKISILANVSPEIVSIFGRFIDKYRDKSLELRW